MHAARWKLVRVVVTTLLVTSIASKSLAYLLHIQDPRVEHVTFGTAFSGPPILVLGSSVTFFGISLPKVAEAVHTPVTVRSIGAASPAELEPLQREVPDPKMTLIGVSIFDLNEQNLSPAKPLLVPFVRSAIDLYQSKTSWRQSKRLLSAYPVQWVRYLFPTAGRSPEVMVGLRDFLAAVTHRARSEESPTKLLLTSEDVSRPEKITDWNEARLLRRLAELRVSGLDENVFAGPKELALDRVLQRAFSKEGGATIMVLPVSPPYYHAFVNEDSATRFERALQKRQEQFPTLKILRLDKEPALHEPAVFWDLVHLNDDGRRLATSLLLKQLGQ